MAPVNRRGVWIAIAVALVTGTIAAWWLRSGAVAPAHSGPVVLISIDTLRADRLPLYGSTRTTTPNLDGFARDAIVFDNAYAHSPQTLPSHTSILSGQLPFEHGVRDNIGYTVRPGQRFLQHILADRGYTTAAFLSSYVLRRQTGINQGFTTYDDALPAVSSATPLGQVQRPGDQTVAAALSWINAQPASKFFLFTHLFEPHTPYEAPAGFLGADAYDAEVSYADALVGKLLDHFRVKQLYDAALIVILSDHGEGLGNHGEDEHGIFLYRETIRVPLLVKLPRSAHGGRRIAAPVQHIDLLPTIAALTGSLEAAGGGHGRSLVSLLDGSAEIAATPIYSESLSPRLHFGWSELYALTDERHRYIRAPRDELYDVAADPTELTSVAAQRPQVRSAMQASLERLIATATVQAPSAISEEDRRKLAALGYVGMPSPSAAASSRATGADPKDKIHLFEAYRRATRLVAEMKFDEATAIYRKMLLDDSGMTDVWLQLAEAYQRQGRNSDALSSFKEVIARRPNDPAGLIGAASALLRLGRIAEARAHADVATGPAPAAAHELLSRIALGSGDIEAARRHARLAQQADATLPMPAFVEGVVLYQQGRFDLAAERFLEVRTASANRTEQITDVSYLAADSLARLERYAEAEPLFRAELAISPAHVRARAGLAMLYQATGRPSDANAAIEAMLRVSPTPEAYGVAAELWQMFGVPGKAAAAKARASRSPR
ncbi:MAG TPA: sulfatase-like hydrolase/transferase [Vicinamibacterales bacterium]|nr:sulfatase-like hydrolase/transferase [Vicinamibacterales bacterium]